MRLFLVSMMAPALLLFVVYKLISVGGDSLLSGSSFGL